MSSASTNSLPVQKVHLIPEWHWARDDPADIVNITEQEAQLTWQTLRSLSTLPGALDVLLTLPMIVSLYKLASRRKGEARCRCSTGLRHFWQHAAANLVPCPGHSSGLPPGAIHNAGAQELRWCYFVSCQSKGCHCLALAPQWQCPALSYRG